TRRTTAGRARLLAVRDVGLQCPGPRRLLRTRAAPPRHRVRPGRLRRSGTRSVDGRPTAAAPRRPARPHRTGAMRTLDLPAAVRDPGRTARWAGIMFLLVILLQRFAVP